MSDLISKDQFVIEIEKKISKPLNGKFIVRNNEERDEKKRDTEFTDIGKMYDYLSKILK